MYEIKILSDQEFESLPYPEMETSLGVADPKTRTAYVRKTGIQSIDAFNIAHELEHLEYGHNGKHADHYRNGVYYKGFREIFNVAAPALASFIPGIGPIAGPALGAGLQAFNQPKQKQQEAPQSSIMGAFQTPQQQPQQASPNIITPGGGGQGFGSEASSGGSAIEKLRGFFSNRNPVGGF